jgi:hypothetical protein
MYKGRGFINPKQPNGPSFPSIDTMANINCVSIDNFALYIDKIPDYQQYRQHYIDTLQKAITKIKTNTGYSWYDAHELKIINDIIQIIVSEPQTDEDNKPYPDGRLKTICPELLKKLRSSGIITGGKYRRQTNKQKIRKHSHKNCKSKKNRKSNRSSNKRR